MMIKLFKHTLLIALFFGTYSIQAQDEPCGHDHMMEEYLNENPEAKEFVDALNEQALNFVENNRKKSTAGGPARFIIPVVVHVMYDNHHDNISRTQIEDALRVINLDFRRLNQDTVDTRAIFQSVAADTEIEFRLAKIDPNGNCTEGIVRIQTSATVGANDNVKSISSSWDRTKYLNIWTVRSISIPSSNAVLGYAYFPAGPNQLPTRDGIVIRHDQMGTIGTAGEISPLTGRTSVGRTLTHEAGHYFSLFHPFSGGCNGGDQVGDTPPVLEANFGCDKTVNSCSNDNPDLPDQTENYMDYSNDACMNMFTIGQRTRMTSALSNFNSRGSLSTSANLIATGITNPPACANMKADFSSSTTVICEGESVQFYDETEDGDPTSYTWTTPGGTISNQGDKNPVVTYASAGVYPVSLNVSNSGGSNSITKTEYIEVKAAAPSYNLNWSENFEAPLSKPDVNILDYGDNNPFVITNSAGNASSSSLLLQNLSTNRDDEVDEFISPRLSTLWASSLNLSFDYAYASQNTDDDDELQVYISTDCGASWNLRRTYSRFSLRTASETSANFVPTQSEWKTVSINFSSSASNDPIMLKWRFISGGGNNIYLDNINFSGVLGVEESALERNMQIYPNPNNGSFKLQIDKEGLKEIDLSIIDLTGKLVFRKSYELTSGKLNENLDLNLGAGTYILQINTQDEQLQRKLIIN